MSSDSVLQGKTIPDELLEVIDELDFTDELEDFAELLDTTDDDDCATELLLDCGVTLLLLEDSTELLDATDDDDCTTELLDLVLVLDTLVSLLLDCGVTLLLLEDSTELLDTFEELVPSTGSGTLDELDSIPPSGVQDDEEETFEDFTHLPSSQTRLLSSSTM